MPLYEYRCTQCGTVSEHLVDTVAARADIVCSHCGSTQVEQCFSVVNVGRASRTASQFPSPCHECTAQCQHKKINN